VTAVDGGGGGTVADKELAEQLQKQCAVVPSPVMMPPVMPGVTTTAGLHTSEQLQQLVELLRQKNESWSASPSSPASDRQLVVADELQNISKVCVRLECLFIWLKVVQIKMFLWNQCLNSFLQSYFTVSVPSFF